MKGQETLFSHASDAWATPADFYRELNDKYKFDLDPCPLNYTVDGLTIPWVGNIYINPPYSDCKSFLEKGFEELKIGNAKKLVYLLPARTCTKWFHKYLWDSDKDTWRERVRGKFLQGRLTFGTDEYWQWVWEQETLNGKKNSLYGKYGKKNAAPFPSLLAIIS